MPKGPKRLSIGKADKIPPFLLPGRLRPALNPGPNKEPPRNPTAHEKAIRRHP